MNGYIVHKIKRNEVCNNAPIHKRIVKTILVGYVIKFIRNKLSGKSSHPTDNKHK